MKYWEDSLLVVGLLIAAVVIGVGIGLTIAQGR